MRRIIASLDVGSNTIKLVVGEFFKKRLNILAVNEVPSQGIKRGIVINPELTMQALEELFNRTEAKLDVPINEVIVNVPSNDLETIIVSGETPVSDLENRIVTTSDLSRVLENAVLYRISENREIVNISPIKFLIDDIVSTNPLGQTGNKLMVKAVVNTIPKKNLYGILSVLEKMEINVIDFTVSGMADYFTYQNNDYDTKCGAVINLGAEVTTVSIINKGIITASEVIDIGGHTIDNDLSIVYKIHKSDGKSLKEKIGLASSINASVNESLTFTNRFDEAVNINQKETSQVIESRLKEILDIAKKQINLLTKKDISYIIITGGVSELKDFDLLLEEVYGNKVTLGTIDIMGVRSNKYSTCVGLIKYFDNKIKMKNEEYSVFDEEALKELTRRHKSGNASLIDKLFGYFFDN